MSDVSIPDFVLIFLLFAFWLSTTFLIGRAIRNEPAIPENTRWIFYYYDFGDWIQFGFGILLLIATLYFLFMALRGATSLDNLPTSEERYRFIGLFTSFIALGLSMFVISANLLKEVHSAVINRVRFNRIYERFDELEHMVRRI
jgi:hypothetical protein